MRGASGSGVAGKTAYVGFPCFGGFQKPASRLTLVKPIARSANRTARAERYRIRIIEREPGEKFKMNREGDPLGGVSVHLNFSAIGGSHVVFIA